MKERRYKILWQSTLSLGENKEVPPHHFFLCSPSSNSRRSNFLKRWAQRTFYYLRHPCCPPQWYMAALRPGDSERPHLFPPNQDRFLGKKRTKKRMNEGELFDAAQKAKLGNTFFQSPVLSCFSMMPPWRVVAKGVKKLTLTAKRWAIMSFYRVLEAL